MKFTLMKTGIPLMAFIIFLGSLSFLAGYETADVGDTKVSARRTTREILADDRIYLNSGVIFAYKDNPKKEFNIILSPTMHINREIYKKLIFFETPEEAESAGFKSSENFARDYACVKAGKDFYECYQEKAGVQ